jgi:hypothetical protein
MDRFDHEDAESPVLLSTLEDFDDEDMAQADSQGHLGTLQDIWLGSFS